MGDIECLDLLIPRIFLHSIH